MTKGEMLLNFCETFPTSVAAICSILKAAEVMEAVGELRAKAGIPKTVLPPTPGMGARDPNDLP